MKVFHCWRPNLTLSLFFNRRLPAVSGGKQAGLCGGVGRMQPFLPLLLYVAVGETEQPLSAMPAGVVHSAYGQVTTALELGDSVFKTSLNSRFISIEICYRK